MNRETRRSKCESQRKEKQQKDQNLKFVTRIPLMRMPDAYELPLFDYGWPIYLQLQMLDALCMFGNQNWQMVANYLNSDFTAQNIRDHYYTFYQDHSSDDPYKLNSNMLTDDEGFDIYDMAKKKNQLRQKNQMKDQKRKQKEDEQQNQKREQFIKKRLPAQFGYEQHKKLFAQPLNEQAQIMILYLTINPDEKENDKALKIKVLKQYDKMVSQREIVEKQVMMNDLMECKYSIPIKNLNSQYSQSFADDISSNSRRFTPSKKSTAKQKSKKKETIAKTKKQRKQDIFFNLKRIENQELSSLHFVYMKMMKYDENDKMKELLKAYEKQCQKQKLLKQKLIQKV